MNGDVLDPDAARERLAAWRQRAEQVAANTQAMSERIGEIRVTAGDPQGLAQVTVDSTGSMVDLRLTDEIKRKSPDVVSRAVLAALAAARNQAADRSQEIVTDTLGADSAAGQEIAQRLGDRLRSGPDPAEPAERPARPPRDEYDDYDVTKDFRS
ncbi:MULTISPECIES: YbaB/EbfC family nucleoid-associated protein [Saccharopolyspora]|uniref:YbaB/EbfC family DNA-binding protein n=1 Tax=Saccharopolyspora gregorii TaxID=33914 RepID=A0ABP6RL94_9PSEU|nr:MULTISPECIES: YbaB/EbfC family nucleoid-associated protein [Saccharopolyspora]MCA1185323.1 YbaB/EbfC family nucleoid-associated protein [Saccharopolyspora sp. 6T]MCA1224664.1 YbaB/EbfC family nucleoid-associated protein [Saccharopolyspora sp. 6M]MCA1279410.1 YbaB/EbfC family nucleoid-associated protein [Saccharopolyspora sp. 7B]